MLSPLTRPLLPSGVLLLNSVPAKVTVWPYVLLVLAAVIVRSRLFTVSARDVADVVVRQIGVRARHRRRWR